jgi:hypothetical protein
MPRASWPRFPAPFSTVLPDLFVAGDDTHETHSLAPGAHRASGRPAPLGQGPPISRLRRRSAPHQIRARIKRTPGSPAYTRRTP